MRTHTFNGRKYTIEEHDGLDGICEMPTKSKTLYMILMRGNTRKALNVAVHEMMHAEEVPDRLVEGGAPDRIAAALWRMGWRRAE